MNDKLRLGGSIAAGAIIYFVVRQEVFKLQQQQE